MGFLDGIAAVGLAGRGYNETDQALARKKMGDMALEEAIRKDATAKGLRAAMAGIGARPDAAGVDMTSPVENDPYGEGYVSTEKGITTPGGVDVRGKAKAASDYLANQGDLEGSDRYAKLMKAMDDEGYRSIVTGVAAGKNPKQIAAEFNQKGQKRIVGAKAEGTNYTFRYEDGTESTYNQDQMRNLATAQGFLKKPETKIVPQGSVETIDGKPVFTNPKPVTPRNIDPNSPQGIEARLDFATRKEKLGLGTGGKDTAQQKNFKFLTQDLGVDPDRATSIAFNVNKNGKSYEERVRLWTTALKSDVNLGLDAKKLIETARALAKEFDAEERTKSATAAPKAAAKASPGVAGGLPAGYSDSGKRTKGGKRLLIGPDGQQYVEE